MNSSSETRSPRIRIVALARWAHHGGGGTHIPPVREDGTLDCVRVFRHTAISALGKQLGL